MRIDKLEIYYTNFCDKVTEVVFDSYETLITSNENSVGKTTLLRFLLFSMGFKIPSTKKVDMLNYSTKLFLCNNEDIIIKRDKDDLFICYSDASEVHFVLSQENERLKALSVIFGISSIDLVRNLLGSFYIDQEKGWTLLNRGKIIGENQFNIEDFLVSFGENNLNEIKKQIKDLDFEIKKYKTILDLGQLKNKVNESKEILKQDNENYDLIMKKNLINYDIIKLNEEIKKIDSILAQNENLIDVVENMGLIITYNKEQFVLSRNHIQDFDMNQNILKAKLTSLKIELGEKKEELAAINVELNKKTLFDVDSISDEVLNDIRNINIDEVTIKHYIDLKLKDKKKLTTSRNNIIKYSKYDITTFLANTIKELSTGCKVFTYIEKEKNYIFTRNLKSLSGTVLHQLALCYKLSYVLTIEKFLGLSLPIIIDSPGSSEITLDVVNDMIMLIKGKCPNHQLIVASAYNELSTNFKQVIKLNDKFMKESIYK